jgi:hypothetical protein
MLDHIPGNVRCQSCGLVASGAVARRWRSTRCTSCRSGSPPGSAAHRGAHALPAAIEAWRDADLSRAAYASGGGIELREVGHAGEYRVAYLESAELAIQAVRTDSIRWREITPRAPLTTYGDRVGCGLDGTWLSPHR